MTSFAERPEQPEGPIVRARSVVASLEDPAEDERIHAIALKTADGDSERAHEGISLARRRAERALLRKRSPSPWFDGPDWTLDRFVVQCVADAARLRSIRTGALDFLGCPPADRANYDAARRYALRLTQTIGGYPDRALAEEVLQDVIAKAIVHFASATNADIENPEAYARRMIRNAVLDRLSPTRGGRTVPAGLGSDGVAEEGPDLEQVVIGSELVSLFRLGLSAMLFEGELTALVAALGLGIVAVEGEGAGLSAWPWTPSMPAPAGGARSELKYLVLRKTDPRQFTPDGVWSARQRQASLRAYNRAIGALVRLLPEGRL